MDAELKIYFFIKNMFHKPVGKKSGVNNLILFSTGLNWMHTVENPEGGHGGEL
jgi:hypothetical protein